MYYADNLHNLPPAFVKLLASFPTVHNVSIFLTIRQARSCTLLYSCDDDPWFEFGRQQRPAHKAG